MKKLWAAATLAASVAGVMVGAAPQALAAGDDGGTTSINGNGAQTAYGNSSTSGDQSPQAGLVQGSLNNLCLGVPVKANVASLVGATPISVQDINVLSSPQNQQCAQNSTQAKGDEPLSHLVNDIPILSANGKGNANG